MTAAPEVTRVEWVTDKTLIRNYFLKDPFLNAYSLGDLDPFFWSRTKWLAAYSGDELLTILLIYQDEPLPVVLAVDLPVDNLGHNLLSECADLLPDCFYSHLSPLLHSVMDYYYNIEDHSTHIKMGVKPSSFRSCDNASGNLIRKVSSADLKDIENLYEKSYPGNWFAARMLETEKYYGMFAKNQLIGIAGVHVYSKEYGVSALGNITIAPEFRGKGLARELTSALCEDLLQETPIVTLNVKADNEAAIRCYEKLGFRSVGTYEEALMSRKGR